MLVDHLGFSCLESYDKYMPVCIPYVVAAAASATVDPWENYYGIYPLKYLTFVFRINL